MKYYERLRFAREQCGLTQREMAAAIDISQTAYNRYERGKNEMPVDRLAATCRVLNISSDYILGLPADCPYPFIR